MAYDITKAEITGPCQITFGGIVVGHTIDGVELEAKRNLTEVFVDRYGKTPIDLVLTGQDLTLKFKMAQTEWDQWNIAIPETSSYDGAGVADRADFGADAGYSLRANGDAKPLVMHPLKNAATDFSDDVTIYLAVSSDDIKVPFKIDEQKCIEVTMRALVSEAYGTGRRLGHYGPADVS
jgi:hypothetical protein